MADAKPDGKPAGTDGNVQINLKVRDTDTNTIQFKIKRSTPLKKLMDAYSSRLFMFDGERLADDDTPEKLEMDDLDVIDAILEQQGGVSCL